MQDARERRDRWRQAKDPGGRIRAWRGWPRATRAAGLDRRRRACPRSRPVPPLPRPRSPPQKRIAGREAAGQIGDDDAVSSVISPGFFAGYGEDDAAIPAAWERAFAPSCPNSRSRCGPRRSPRQFATFGATPGVDCAIPDRVEVVGDVKLGRFAYGLPLERIRRTSANADFRSNGDFQWRSPPSPDSSCQLVVVRI
jgi:hypothetical protein